MDALIIACVLGIAILGGFLLSLIPEAPPPGLTRDPGRPRPSMNPLAGNHPRVEAATNPPHGRMGRLIAYSGSIWRTL